MATVISVGTIAGKVTTFSVFSAKGRPPKGGSQVVQNLLSQVASVARLCACRVLLARWPPVSRAGRQDATGADVGDVVASCSGGQFFRVMNVGPAYSIDSTG